VGVTSNLPEVLRRADAEGPPIVVEPISAEEVAAVLSHASRHRLAVQVVGGGTHSGHGTPVTPDIVLSMTRLDAIERWEPEDLTAAVGAGARVLDLESQVNTRNQTLGMPEHPGAATVGGTIASGASTLRRGRLLGIRERVLETTVVTGDGRIVRSGGRVVKNVTGFDLSRLHVGAFGALGVLVSVCLKLWPTPPTGSTITVDTPEEVSSLSRPLAVLEDRDGVRAFVWGTEREVSAIEARFGGAVQQGLDWPVDPHGEYRWSLRVPPKMTAGAIGRVPPGWDFLALHGVGEVRLASADHALAGDLRDWAESVGGHLVLVSAPDGAAVGIDPWGSPPPGLELQRALIARFDPFRVLNRGRLPGGL
jgi:glycolate oxidase FAD binding subunit